MSERPIIFSAPMVRAILDGRKTQTRRVVKPWPSMQEIVGTYGGKILAFKKRLGDGYWIWPNAKEIIINECPYGQRGDRLWVRENFAFVGGGDPGLLLCQADWQETAKLHKCDNADKPPRWKPSIHMPRRASRITLEITGIRVERLQDISEEDARAEGAMFHDGRGIGHSGWRHDYKDVHENAKSSFNRLWNDINGAGSWRANPWVWCISFERVK